MHGYGIAIRIQQISVEVFQVNPGSLFPAFNRLELPATFTRAYDRIRITFTPSRPTGFTTVAAGR